MKSKEIYALVGVAVLIVIFAWWGSGRDMAQEGTQTDTNKEETATVSPVAPKPASKPNTSASKPASSVNPTVVSEKPTPVVPTAQSLNGSTFKLASYNGAAVPADSKYTLTFTNTDFSLKLCNIMSSSYYITNNVIKANNVVSTQMYCGSPANLMKMETDAALMLNSGVATIYKSGSTLILSHNSGITMAFEGF